MKPRFSIIIPVFNVEKFLHQCIGSVLSQTYRNFELLLVNDGSTDTSGEICEKFKSKDSRITVIHKSNGGQSDARNVGLKMAVGDYVFFIDSDDYLINNGVFNELSEKLSLHTEVILFKFQKYFDNKKKLTECSFNFPMKITGKTDLEWLKDCNNQDAFYNSAWSKIVRRSLLVDNGIYFEKELLGEDNDWFYSVLLHARKFDYIDKAFIIYRQRDNSTTSSLGFKNLADLIYICEKWIDVLSHNSSYGESGEVIYASLAKQYCHAIIAYERLSDRRKVCLKPKLLRLRFLLEYSENKRVKSFRILYRLVGFNGVIMLLSMRNQFLD